MSRLLPLFVSGLLSTLAAVAPAGARPTPPKVTAQSAPVTPRDAIVAAVRARMGQALVSVDVDPLETSVVPATGLVAVPDPAGRAGRATRFTLATATGRKGTAVATVRVRALVARARAAIERGATLDADSLTVVEDDVHDVPLAYLPTAEELVGRRVRRAVAPGELLTLALAEVPPAVQSGDPVTIAVTVGRVHATTVGVASGSGRVGDIVRVQRPGQRALLAARVLARGEVEVLP